MAVGVPPRVAAAVAGLVGGDAPVCAYVYDRVVLREVAGAVRAALPPGAVLLYAMKANGHPDVVAELARVVDGVEVASGGELAAAVAAGAGQVVFGGPAKTDGQLAAAVAAGALVNVESVLELRRLDLVARAAGVRVEAAVRVNRPAGGLAGSHAMAGVATQFGVDEARLGEVVAVAAGLPGVRLVGFSLHAVSNNLDAAAHARFVVDALAWAVAAGGRFGVAVEYVNVGGGFGVDYAGGRRFDLAVLRAGLAGLVVPPGVRLVFEPGRLLVADAGWYAAQVVDVKRTQGRWFAVLRGGTHHFRLPAAWGYDHPFVVLPVSGWPYPFARPQVRAAAVDVVGELCTPRDVLCRGQVVDRLRAGDVVVFGRAGAYGWDISHHDFLRHPYPRMVVV
ncbi:type III PLP-dependent enzyme [Micromonospora sp. NBC_01813]|uniref:type III PLP-dependent enzyme n=1 Tax=Micromonospora sp. NBC_01813 TaxID=2975988 RepID=UPI002DDB7718|nr:type III PLP-dependent enzyme [Micromonospora sp. NBC_01813]WSA10459.1 type III PLP-dependent enzyme [Micromonospora sp. NBC_01813]